MSAGQAFTRGGLSVIILEVSDYRLDLKREDDVNPN